MEFAQYGSYINLLNTKKIPQIPFQGNVFNHASPQAISYITLHATKPKPSRKPINTFASMLKINTQPTHETAHESQARGSWKAIGKGKVIAESDEEVSLWWTPEEKYNFVVAW